MSRPIPVNLLKLEVWRRTTASLPRQHDNSPLLSFFFLFFLPAVQLLNLKVRVEVKDDALRRLRRCDDPTAVLVGRVLQRVAGSRDVAGVTGIQVATARLRSCGGGDRGTWSQSLKCRCIIMTWWWGNFSLVDNWSTAAKCFFCFTTIQKKKRLKEMPCNEHFYCEFFCHRFQIL